ncbi:MAG: hypothetical protein AB1505_28895 [Candidatus Latescibacterota bacterium]
MKAGYAETDITPDPGEEMTGYGYFLNRRATGTLDPLRARALALEAGEGRAVVVQLDLLGLAADYVEGVRAAVAERTGLSPAGLLLHCTHTHSGPGSRPLFGCGSPSAHFLRLLHGRLVATVEAALADLRPVQAASRFAADWPEGFAHNRVGAGELDTQVRGVRLEVEGGRPIVVVSYACHPVTLGVNREYSADYCGAVLRELNAYGLRALYLNGPCGDVDPVSNAYRWGSGTRETLLIYGRDLAAVARQAMQRSTPWRMGPVRLAARHLALEVESTGPEALRASLEGLRGELRGRPEDGGLRADAMWHELMLCHHWDGTVAQAAQAEVQAIACGEVVLVGLGAETFTALGQAIRAAAPAHHLLIAGTSNGVLGYIGTEEDVRRGHYASRAACKLYGMGLPTPGAGEAWAAAGARVVAEAIGAGE